MPSIEQVVDFLEAKQSLKLGQSPWDPGDLSEEYEILQVDYKKLLPLRKRAGRDGAPWELYGDDWEMDPSPDLEEIIERVLRPLTDHEHPGPMEPRDHWDTCAWYQPIHFHAYDYGIYIKEECLCELARRLCQSFLPVLLPTWGRPDPWRAWLLFKALIRTAFLLYYRHELFHHKTECLGLRLHVVENKSSYIPYMRLVYGAAVGTDDLLEEGLANAHMYREMRASAYSGWIPPELAQAAREYLDGSFALSPPGYRTAPRYLENVDFAAGENLLKAQVHEANLIPARAVDEWGMTPRLSQSFFNIRGEIWTVVRKGALVLLPTTSLPVKTCSTSALISICRRRGYEEVRGGKGSHVKMKKARAPTIIIPGNRSNVSPGAAKNILRALGNYRIQDIPRL